MGIEEKDPDILYHYCSTAAFHSIISSRSIRLSALALSNDSMEGKMTIEALSRVAKHDGLEPEKFDLLLKILALHHEEEEGFGFCLSSRGDWLSQWRGYADDARGVSIGFSKVWLEKFIEVNSSFSGGVLRLEEVNYDKDAHDSVVRPLYEDYKRAMNDVPFDVKRSTWIRPRIDDSEIQRIASIKANLDFHTMMTRTAFQFILKSSAFSEEKEWRLLRSIDIKKGESNRGTASKVRYAPKGDRMIAYVEHPLDDMEVDGQPMKLKPIKEVILGPKHFTPTHMVDQFLKSHGFIAHVEKSAASYR